MVYAGNTVKLTGFEYGVLMDDGEQQNLELQARDLEFSAVEVATKNSVSLSSDVW